MDINAKTNKKQQKKTKYTKGVKEGEGWNRCIESGNPQVIDSSHSSHCQWPQGAHNGRHMICKALFQKISNLLKHTIIFH